MAIEVPRVITYSNRIIRPTCETMRNLKAIVDAALITWTNEIASDCPDNATEILIDGRAADGVSILNGEDLNNVIDKFLLYQNALNQAGTAEIISKPCVRPLRVVI